MTGTAPALHPAGMNDVNVGATYRHYKQLRYRVLMIAVLEATEEELVIYETLYENDRARVWARPKSDFLAEVRTDTYRGPRFALESGNDTGNAPHT